MGSGRSRGVPLVRIVVYGVLRIFVCKERREWRDADALSEGLVDAGRGAVGPLPGPIQSTPVAERNNTKALVPSECPSSPSRVTVMAEASEGLHVPTGKSNGDLTTMLKQWCCMPAKPSPTQHCSSLQPIAALLGRLFGNSRAQKMCKSVPSVSAKRSCDAAQIIAFAFNR